MTQTHFLAYHTKYWHSCLMELYCSDSWCYVRRRRDGQLGKSGVGSTSGKPSKDTRLLLATTPWTLMTSWRTQTLPPMTCPCTCLTATLLPRHQSLLGTMRCVQACASRDERTYRLPSMMHIICNIPLHAEVCTIAGSRHVPCKSILQPPQVCMHWHCAATSHVQ